MTKLPALPARIIIAAGLLAGGLDIAAAMIDFYLTTGKNPETVLRFVASGFFGKEAFTGSWWMNIWGLLFHYLIAFGFTICFYLLYRTWPAFRRYPVITVILFSIFMWAFTNILIIPLSRIQGSQVFQCWKAAKATAILLFMISIPLLLIFRTKYAWRIRNS